MKGHRSISRTPLASTALWLLPLVGPVGIAHAGVNVALIERNVSGGLGLWCQFFRDNGHACTSFPSSGPTSPLDGFDVVFNTSADWSDPNGLLADFMRAGKGVVVWTAAAWKLGVNTDPTVQAWIGANGSSFGGQRLRTVTTDILLGALPVGTLLTDCSDAGCRDLRDATGHPNATVLARFDPGSVSIGLMRNEWEGGRSVFMTDAFPVIPVWAPIILNSVRWAAGDPIIPTTSTWSLIALTLLLASAGTVLVRRRAGVWVR